jgi:hypothetical protein
MVSPRYLILGAALLFTFAATPARAFNLSFSASDFGTSPVFSEVETFAVDIEIAGPLQAGLYSDPIIMNIQYSVSGLLDPSPSDFPGFGFQLDHIFPSSPPITGVQFYALNASSVPGETLRFEVSGSADLSDGLQIDELVDLGSGVVFRFNGREEGTGRYHPTFIELKSDGTGRIQNADNMGGINPATMMLVDVGFGDEYVTDLTFTPSTLTIAVPEPGLPVLLLVGAFCFAAGRRRAGAGSP